MAKPQVDIIGVPLDFGVKELGLKIGPDAFREAGLIEILHEADIDVRDMGNLEMRLLGEEPMNPRARHAASIALCCERIADRVAASIAAGRIPVCLGGDHSLSIGSLAGVARAVGDPGCIWIDAHPDANTPQTSPSGNVHGMPVAVVLGHGVESLVSLAPAGPKVQYGNMSLLGTRDIDPGEAAFLKEHDVQMFSVFDTLERGLPRLVDLTIQRATQGAGGVHVSLDLDSLRDDIAPGVGLRSSCGFDMREISYICERIAGSCRVTSIDIVGLNPVRDVGRRTALIGIELLTSLLGSHLSCSYCGYLRQQARTSS